MLGCEYEIRGHKFGRVQKYTRPFFQPLTAIVKMARLFPSFRVTLIDGFEFANCGDFISHHSLDDKSRGLCRKQ